MGTILKVYLDKPHSSFVHVEVVCGPPGLPPGSPVGSKGWVNKTSVVLSTSLTAAFQYEAGGPDECGFNENDKVYGFKEMDGWWDGYSTNAGMFPANYVTVDSPQPTFAVASTPPPPPPPSFSEALNVTPPPPSYDKNPMVNESMGMGGTTAVPIKTSPPLIDKKNTKTSEQPEGLFKGKKTQQYAIWARNLGLAAAWVIFWCGIFTVYWDTNAK